MLVASWDDGTNNIRNYEISAFILSGSSYLIVGSKLVGQFFETSTTGLPFKNPTIVSPPSFSVSPSLETVAVYGKATSTSTFSRKMIIFNYSGNSSQEITFDTTMNWMTTTSSSLAVSDTYLYTWNVADK